MPSKIIITSDSTTDLSPALRERYGVQLMPLGINLNDKEYTDGIDIDPEMIYENYRRNKTLPKTAAPNLEDCSAFFRRFVEQGFSVVHFTISSEMSSTYQNSVIAAQDFDDVHVVDTQNLSTGGGLLVIRAAELAQKGLSAGEIARDCRALAPFVDASFVIDSLEFLHKGGRCSTVAALGANILRLRPEIVIEDGGMHVGKKFRGPYNKCVYDYIDDRLSRLPELETDLVYVNHTIQNPEFLEELLAYVREKTGCKQLIETPASAAISTHCGPNTFGFFFVRKEK